MSNQKHKADEGKLQYRLIPPAALKLVAEALTHGAKKYSEHTWRHVESRRYVDATYRHLEAARSGDRIDADSGLPHLALAITNLMFLLERQETSYEDTNEFSYYAEAQSEALAAYLKGESN